MEAPEEGWGIMRFRQRSFHEGGAAEPRPGFIGREGWKKLVRECHGGGNRKCL